MDNQLIPVFRDAASKARYLAACDAALAQWPVPYSEQDIPTRLGLAHVNVSGPPDGAPLVLLPGNLECAVMWQHNIAALSASHRVYAVDVIGDVGKSQAYRLPASREDHMDWLVDLVDALQIATFDLMGASYGGYLVASLALRLPERVQRLILLCPGLPLARPTLHWMIRGMPMILAPSRCTATWFLEGASASKVKPKTFVAGIAGVRSTMVLRPSIDAEELKGLIMPVLLLVGEREIMYPAKQAVARARQLIPHLQAAIIPNAGHFLASDRPKEVNQIVCRFLDDTTHG